MAQEESISNTQLKLEEAQYFFEQVKANLANPKYFKFNLSAFASASRSVISVMLSEYKIKVNSEDPSWKWFKEYVLDSLANEEIPHFFKELRNMLLKENKSPSEILTVVSSMLTIRWGNMGSAPENEEESKKPNSEPRSAAAPAALTIYQEPESRDLTKKYVWYFPDNTVKTSENKRYVVKSCEVYLERLSELVDECEKKFAKR
jgi:hypothetical protein